jgi:hypothetical protein
LKYYNHSNLNYYAKTTLNLNQSKLNTLFEQLKQHSPSADITHKKGSSAWCWCAFVCDKIGNSGVSLMTNSADNGRSGCKYSLAFEQLKTKLRDKGLFDAKHKKPLPTKVDTIGVISSSNGDLVGIKRNEFALVHPLKRNTNALKRGAINLKFHP